MISIELYCLTRRSGTLVCVSERHTLHVGTLLPAGCSSMVFVRQYRFSASASVATSDRSYGCHFGFCLQRLIPGAPASCPLRSPRNWWAGFRRHPACAGAGERWKITKGSDASELRHEQPPCVSVEPAAGMYRRTGSNPIRFKPLLGRSCASQLAGESKFPCSAKVVGVDCYLDTVASASGGC
jgi:hypothetical protein